MHQYNISTPSILLSAFLIFTIIYITHTLLRKSKRKLENIETNYEVVENKKPIHLSKENSELLQTELDKYINLHKSMDESCGFIDGFEKAVDLLEALRSEDSIHLEFIHNRMIDVYGENRNVDFVEKLRYIINR